MNNNKNNINDWFDISIELVEIVDPYENDKLLQNSLNKRIKQLRRINRYNAVMHLLIQNDFKSFVEYLKTILLQ